MKTNPKASKIPSPLHSLIEHIVRGVLKELDKARLARKVKEQSVAANAGPVSGPMITKKKKPMEEITTSAAAGPYSVPGAFSGGNLKKDLSHIEVLGYKLTPQGKADMNRKADKLYENTEPTPTKKCQNCGHPMPAGKSRCEKCKRLQDDTPKDKKLKYGAAQLQEGCPHCGDPQELGSTKCKNCLKPMKESSGLGADFDRAQRQYDTQQPPEGDGLECPECGGTNGYYTQKERSGRYFVWTAECPDCHAQWGDDNLDSDRDER